MADSGHADSVAPGVERGADADGEEAAGGKAARSAEQGPLCPCVLHHEATLSLGPPGDARTTVVCIALDTNRGHLLVSTGSVLHLWAFDDYDNVEHTTHMDEVQRFLQKRLYGGVHREVAAAARDAGRIAHIEKAKVELKGENNNAGFAAYSRTHDVFFVIQGKASLWAYSAVDHEKKLLSKVDSTEFNGRFMLGLAVFNAKDRSIDQCVTSEVGGVIRLWTLTRSVYVDENNFSNTRRQLTCERVLVSAPSVWLHNLGVDNSDCVIYAACGTGLAAWEVVRHDGELGEVSPEVYAEELHNMPVTCVAYLNDTHRYATGSSDRSVRIWDFAIAQTPTLINQLINHEGPVHTLGASLLYGRSRLVSTSGDGTVRVWDVDRGIEIDRLRLREGSGEDCDTVEARKGNPGITPWLEEKGEKLRLEAPKPGVQILCDRQLFEYGLGFNLSVNDFDDHGITMLTACDNRIVVCRVYAIAEHLFTGPSHILSVSEYDHPAESTAVTNELLTRTDEGTIQFVDEVDGLLSRIVAPEIESFSHSDDTDDEPLSPPRPPPMPRPRSGARAPMRRHHVAAAGVTLPKAEAKVEAAAVMTAMTVASDHQRMFGAFSNGMIEAFDLYTSERLTTIVRASRESSAVSCMVVMNVPVPIVPAPDEENKPMSSDDISDAARAFAVATGEQADIPDSSSAHAVESPVGSPRAGSVRGSIDGGQHGQRGSIHGARRHGRRKSLLASAKTLNLGEEVHLDEVRRDSATPHHESRTPPSAIRPSNFGRGRRVSVSESDIYDATSDVLHLAAGTKDGYLYFCKASAAKLQDRTEKLLAHEGSVVDVQGIRSVTNASMSSRMLASLGRTDGVRIWHAFYNRSLEDEFEPAHVTLIPVCHCMLDNYTPLCMTYFLGTEGRPGTLQLVTGMASGELGVFDIGKHLDHSMLASATGGTLRSHAGKARNSRRGSTATSRRVSTMRSSANRITLGRTIPIGIPGAPHPSIPVKDLMNADKTIQAHAAATVRIRGPCSQGHKTYIVTQGGDDVVLVWRWSEDHGKATYVVHKYSFRVGLSALYIPRQMHSMAFDLYDQSAHRDGFGKLTSTASMKNITERIRLRLSSFRMVVALGDTLIELPGLPPTKRAQKKAHEDRGGAGGQSSEVQAQEAGGLYDELASRMRESSKELLQIGKEDVAKHFSPHIPKGEVSRRQFMDTSNLHPHQQRMMKAVISNEIAAGLREAKIDTPPPSVLDKNNKGERGKQSKRDAKMESLESLASLMNLPDLDLTFKQDIPDAPPLSCKTYRETPTEHLREALMVPFSARGAVVNGTLSADHRSVVLPQWNDILKATHSNMLPVRVRLPRVKKPDVLKDGYFGALLKKEKNSRKLAKMRGKASERWTTLTSRRALPPLRYFLTDRD